MSSKIKIFLISTLILSASFLLGSAALAADFGTNVVDESIVLNDTSPVKIATNIINVLMGLLSFLALCLILYSGFIWMTSGGSEEKVSQAKKILKNGAIGLLIILSAWGITYYILTTLVGATSNSNNGADSCTNGSVTSCGCGGAQTCNSGTWGPCLGSKCDPLINNNTSCDGKTAVAQCQADNNLCGADYTCDETTCLCKPKSSLGDSCNKGTSSQCKADDSLCGPYLNCDPDACVCVGPPVITGISPAGGFCVNDVNRGCNQDADCLGGAKCDTITPNGTANNFISIYGYNFGTTTSNLANALTAFNFEKGTVGSVPTDWIVNSQKHASVSLSTDTFKSGKQSLKIHQDANLPYPGTCSKNICQDMASCTWNAINKTCNFTSADQAHPDGPASYSEGQTLVGENSYNVMLAKLNYNLTPLNFKVGETYSIQFYYKGKNSTNVNIQVSPKTDNSSQCVGYDYYSALKSGYTWNGSKVVPNDGTDPCVLGQTCQEQANTCCLNTPYQKKCYNALNLTSISAGNTDDWVLYSYTFQYTPEMDAWLDSTGKKIMEFVLSVGYNYTGAGTDLYIDDFSVTKIQTTGEVTFLGANSSQAQLANFPKALNPNCISYWTDRQITVVVPSGAASGPIQIKREGGLTDNTDSTNNDNGPKIPDFIKNNIVRPSICQVSPTQGTVGSKVAYQGVNLRNSVAYFGEYSNSYKGINSTFSSDNLSGQTLAPSITAGKTTTFVEKTSAGINQKSNSLFFVKEQEPEAGPYISSFYPQNGPVGQYVTILGGGFGNLRGSRQVFFGDQEASYDFPEVCSNAVWSDSQIIVKVPNGLSSGDYRIRINLGDTVINTDLLSPNNTFTLDPSQSLKTNICKIDPIRGQIGDKVVLWGENFGASGTNASVVFNRGIGISSKIVKDSTADKIETTVPVNAMGVPAITGPVHVLKNGEWGNEVNFTVGKCVNNDECNSSSPVCCPANTFKTGSCSASLLSCYFDVPNSVYETKFDTTLSGNTDNEFSSCIEMATFYQGCQTGQFCPNSPGKCSPFNPITSEVIGDCGSTTSECGALLYCKDNVSKCTYNSDKDVCQTSKCQLDKEISYTLNGAATEFKGSLSCRAYNDKTTNKTYFVKQLKVNTSCPTDWINIGNGYCVNTVPVLCEPCPTGFSCQEDNNKTDDLGICESNKICGEGASCGLNNNKYSCLKEQNKSCDCCCEIGQDTRDCCAPLKCAGTCGSDTSDDNKGYGSCSGCSAVGDSASDHDAACNCSSTSGKFCDTSKAGGVCVDCTALNETECSSHSSQCCFDSAKGICQGGDGTILPNGKCAYYDCNVDDKTTCNQTPATTGQFIATTTCVATCPVNEETICDIIGSDSARCSAQNSCCFDNKSKVCKDVASGDLINNTGKIKLDGVNYCTYYDCDSVTKKCNNEGAIDGDIRGLSNCEKICEAGDSLPGISCASETAGVCNTSFCGNPFSCLSSAGSPTPTDCGICCCVPGTKNGDLTCLADKGNCTGAGRGLFCGCKVDKECGGDVQGCGTDTCCYARPSVVNTSPKNNDTNVCRNRQIEIDFSEEMMVTTLANNILLLEEKSYGQGTCPNGSVLSLNNLQPEPVNFLAGLYQQVVAVLKRVWSGNSNGEALAISPTANKLYCVAPITIETQKSYVNGATSTKAFIKPQNLLSANTNYFVVIKGDENLDSNSGVMSIKKIGLNAVDISPISSSPADYSKPNYAMFNGVSFSRSYAFGFATMDDNSEKDGLCAIDKVLVSPVSALIKTTENNPSDDNPLSAEFDKISDSDRAFSAFAYSRDNQLLQPVFGYAWNWNWKIDDESVVTRSNLAGLKTNQMVVNAVNGVTDNSTKIRAIVNTDGFTNVIQIGNGLSGDSDVYVFSCANPWPLEVGGNWNPWSDKCTDIYGNNISGCLNYNYKFYYCRDAGEPGTADDLPPIIDPALILGSSGGLICSTDGSACSAAGAACGNNGTCVWSILKESYFFREAIPQAGEINDVSSTGAGGAVAVSWHTPIISLNTISSFKVYYGLATGKSSSFVIPVSATDTKYCSKLTDGFNCRLVIDKLIDGQPYYFKVSSLTDKKAESPLSGGKEVTPTDTTAPAIPTGLKSKIVDNNVVISWQANTDDTLYYRLFHGLFAGKKAADSVDTPNKAASITLEKTNYRTGNHYFFLSAIDESNNVSGTSNEIEVEIPVEQEK